jgi:hypothetical protein
MAPPIQSLYFAESAAYAPGIFDTLFGGFFLIKGVPLAGQLLWLIFFPVAIVGAWLESRTQAPRYAFLAQTAGWICFVVSFFFLVQPWDEVFINLRHSLHLAEAGTFSFNRLTPLEGTADWLVYYLLGILYSVGLPLEELAFIQGLVGAVVCVVIGRQLWKDWTGATSTTIPTLLLIFFPPLAFNSAHGFATTCYVAAILGSLLLLFRSTPSHWGWVTLSLVPLIRAEGIYVFFLFAACKGYFEKHNRWKTGFCILAAALPWMALCTWRLHTFGSAIPIPIQYKATGADFFYLAIGIRNLFADLISCGAWVSLLILAAIRSLPERKALIRSESQAILLCAALGAAVLPYYLAGGDWFPSYWGRYLLPFSLWVYLLSTALAYQTVRQSQELGKWVWVFAALFLAQSLWPISSSWKYFDHLLSNRRTLAKVHAPTIGRGHYRIQNLSQLGTHLGKTTRPSDVIASSEVATIMYFARREALDLLGVANPEIARSPVRGLPSLLRRFPQDSELPYLIFKRIRPDIVPKNRPEYLYTFDFLWRDSMPEIPFEELDAHHLQTALGRWQRKLGGLIDTLYGGVDAIIGLGYIPIVVRYSNHFQAMYFVRTDRASEHLDRLLTEGFVIKRWFHATKKEPARFELYTQ